MCERCEPFVRDVSRSHLVPRCGWPTDGPETVGAVASRRAPTAGEPRSRRSGFLRHTQAQQPKQRHFYPCRSGDPLFHSADIKLVADVAESGEKATRQISEGLERMTAAPSRCRSIRPGALAGIETWDGTRPSTLCWGLASGVADAGRHWRCPSANCVSVTAQRVESVRGRHLLPPRRVRPDTNHRSAVSAGVQRKGLRRRVQLSPGAFTRRPPTQQPHTHSMLFWGAPACSRGSREFLTEEEKPW